MDRLSIYLTLAVGAMITGGCVIAVLSLGWYSWLAIGTAAAFGLLLTWPASYAISRRIKRQDPHWEDSKADLVNDVIPDPSKPEV
jgi:membrane protein implicated in regulation of membrane protease activity